MGIPSLGCFNLAVLVGFLGIKVMIGPCSLKTKILHLITTLDSGGAETMLYKLLSIMDRGLFDHLVVSLAAGGRIQGKIEALGWPVYDLGMSRGKIPSPSAFFHLIDLLKRESPHIVQTWLYHADFLGVLAGCWNKKVKLVWNIRCAFMDFKSYPSLTRWVVRACAFLSSRPDAVIVNSRAGRLLHERYGYRPKRWEWIPNGFDLDVFRPDLQARKEIRREIGINEEDLAVGMIARFDPMKGISFFLQAARRLQVKMPEVIFILVGPGLEEGHPFFRDHPLRRELGNRLRLLGYRDDVCRILPSLDLAVSTSLGEGFPNAIGEAMACGIPCVVTDVGDSSLLVGDGGTLVPPGDVEKIASEWERVLRSPVEYREEMGKRGRARIEKFFSLRVIKERYERFYQELVGNEEE